MKRQENLTNFMLDHSETIVSVKTGIKTLISDQDPLFPNLSMQYKAHW